MKKVIWMPPQTLDEVEKVVRSRQLWKLGAAGVGTCKRIVRDSIERLALDTLHEKARLERLLRELGD